MLTLADVLKNARPCTEVIISHQALRKQTWQRMGNLKAEKAETNRLVFKPAKELLTSFKPQNQFYKNTTYDLEKKCLSAEIPFKFTETTPVGICIILVILCIKIQSNLVTVEPILRGHPRDKEKCPLNRGVP